MDKALSDANTRKTLSDCQADKCIALIRRYPKVRRIAHHVPRMIFPAFMLVPKRTARTAVYAQRVSPQMPQLVNSVKVRRVHERRVTVNTVAVTSELR